MNNKTSLMIAGAIAAAVASTASGAVIAGWSMATAVAAGTVGSNYSYGAANLGEQTADSMLSGYHALATTAWSSPAGNGSTYSLSSNGWTTSDYYQVACSTAGYDGVSISWNQTRSGTGPALFEVRMSSDGGATWSALGEYAVIQAGLAGTNTTSWNATTYQVAFDMSMAAAGANNSSSVLFRFSSKVTAAAAGTSRIDNIVVSGNMVPAPGALALLGVAGLLSRRRR